MRLVSEQVDIYAYPTEVLYQPGSEISVGDLHGNAIKLFFILVKHGIAGTTEENYQQLVSIYLTPVDELNKFHLDQFNFILDSTDFHNHSSLRLLGDDLADRGSNDYFTLQIFKRLSLAEVSVTVILSNHNVLFLYNHEVGVSDDVKIRYEYFCRSMLHLDVLIKKGLVEPQEINAIVNTHYLKFIKLIDYRFDEEKNQLAIYTHTPVGLEAIGRLARKFNIRDYDYSVSDLLLIIDALNAHLSKHWFENSLNLFNNSLPWNTRFDDLAYLLWNRDFTGLIHPTQKQFYGCKMMLIHGQYTGGTRISRRIHLDNELGKHSEWNKGEYRVLVDNASPQQVNLTPKYQVSESSDEPMPERFDVLSECTFSTQPEKSLELEKIISTLLIQVEKLRYRNETAAADALSRIHDDLLQQCVDFVENDDELVRRIKSLVSNSDSTDIKIINTHRNLFFKRLSPCITSSIKTDTIKILDTVVSQIEAQMILGV